MSRQAGFRWFSSTDGRASDCVVSSWQRHSHVDPPGQLDVAGLAPSRRATFSYIPQFSKQIIDQQAADVTASMLSWTLLAWIYTLHISSYLYIVLRDGSQKSPHGRSWLLSNVASSGGDLAWWNVPLRNVLNRLKMSKVLG